jgi:hypothetical protein
MPLFYFRGIFLSKKRVECLDGIEFMPNGYLFCGSFFLLGAGLVVASVLAVAVDCYLFLILDKELLL